MNNIKDQENINQKIILLRLDLNVPLKYGVITDQTRIDKILPVINFLIKPISGKIYSSFVGEINSNKAVDIHRSYTATIFQNINLIPRLIDPSKGIITIDGTDIKFFEITKLRSIISLVSQDVMLFDLSILENLRLANEKASFQDIEKACKISDAHNFIINCKHILF